MTISRHILAVACVTVAAHSSRGQMPPDAGTQPSTHSPVATGAANDGPAPPGKSCADDEPPADDQNAPDVDTRARDLLNRGSAAFWTGYQQKNRALVIDAVDKLEQALKLDPRMPAAYNILATYYAGIKKPDTAAGLLETGIRHNPTSPILRYTQGVVHSQMNMPAKAIAHYQAAIDLGMKCKEGVFLNIGNAHVKIGSRPQAIDAYQQALAANPSHHKARRALVLVYVQDGNTAAAREHARRLTQLDPNGEFGAWAREALKQPELR